MKVATLFGTRPEIIRLSRVIAALDPHCDQTLIHTGQNYDPRLSDVFFDELGVRQPDVHLGIREVSFASQVGAILSKCGALFEELRPDRLLLLGDTNSALAAIVASRMGIPVYHMEAGNRCYDDRVPEEINRRVIDHSSTILMPYTHRSKENLLREGIERERIFVTGNPIFEVLQHHGDAIDSSSALSRFGVESQGYLLSTIHRAENVDEPVRLLTLLEGLSLVADELDLPLLISVHPRTAERLKSLDGNPLSKRVQLLEPLGLLDFVCLEKNARLVLSDSGTVQEECAILHTPNVTVRDVTERAETIECGSNVLSGAQPQDILRVARLAVAHPSDWIVPLEYTIPDVSRTVARIVLGYTSLRSHS